MATSTAKNYGTGKRKRAIARVFLKGGEGTITVNGRTLEDYFPRETSRMIVNQAFADRYFPGEDALGKKLKPSAGNGMPGGPPWREIVGVVGNIRHFATQREMLPAMYLPASQMPTWCCLRSVLRTSEDPRSIELEARRIVTSMDRDIPVTDVRTMRARSR